jgi:hypothetical protein
MGPEDPGIASAAVPVDAALRDHSVILGAGFFFPFPAAAVLGHFLLSFANGALDFGGELGMKPGIVRGLLGVADGLFEA